MNNRRTRKIRSLIGGKLLAKGSYGCSFFPGFRCGETGTRDKTMLTKLMTKEYAIPELQIAKIIKKIDPMMKYSIYPSKACNPNKINLGTYMNEGFRDCNVHEGIKFNSSNVISNLINKDRIIFLQTKYGGKTIHELIKEDYDTPRQIYDLFKKFLNILKGIEHYQNYNFVHFDISEKNIVCDKNNCRLIDFGFSRSLKEYIPGNPVYDDTFPFTLDNLYVIWPLDAYFMKNWQKLFRNGIPHLANKYVDTFHRNLELKPEIPPEMYMGEEMDDAFIPFNSMDDVYLFYENLLNYMLVFNNGDLKQPSKQLREFIFKQLDVYIIGYTLFNIIYKTTKKKMNYDKIIPIKVSHPNIPDEFVRDCYKLAISMTNLNPFKRLTIKEAVNRYENILHSIKK
jgi:serine/threonine protein kinase